jgi:UDP-GlcNAc:undecaprenyl-phosphate GlcNAc-1-phosphate transferase
MLGTSIMLEMLQPVVTVFIITVVLILILRPLANKFNLVDKPDERKTHDGHIPLIGGIAIYLGTAITFQLFGLVDEQTKIVLLAGAFIVFIGMLDDKYDLPVRFRILGQLLVAALLCSGLGAYIENLGDLFTFGDVELGVLGIPFTYIAVIAAINAYNMIDGIDGLLGGMSVISFVGLAYLFNVAGNEIFTINSLIIIGSILAYLIFNMMNQNPHKYKVFMGDAGSMLIGLYVIWMLIIGSQQTVYGPESFSAVLALFIVGLPLIDMAAIIVRRKRKGQSPFKPDRDHMHHILMRSGFSTKQSLLILLFLSSLLFIVGVFINTHSNSFVGLLLFIVTYISYQYVIQNAWRFSKFLKGND